MVAWARLAEPLGFEALQIYSPDPGHGYLPSGEEIEAYFHEVLDAVGQPVVLSSHESNGYVIPSDVLDRLLSAYRHIVGVNVTSADISYIAEVIDVVHRRAEVHAGGLDGSSPSAAGMPDPRITSASSAACAG